MSYTLLNLIYHDAHKTPQQHQYDCYLESQHGSAVGTLCSARNANANDFCVRHSKLKPAETLLFDGKQLGNWPSPEEAFCERSDRSQHIQKKTETKGELPESGIHKHNNAPWRIKIKFQKCSQTTVCRATRCPEAGPAPTRARPVVNSRLHSHPRQRASLSLALSGSAHTAHTFPPVFFARL